MFLNPPDKNKTLRSTEWGWEAEGIAWGLSVTQDPREGAHGGAEGGAGEGRRLE